jgi:hypothetical protein
VAQNKIEEKKVTQNRNPIFEALNDANDIQLLKEENAHLQIQRDNLIIENEGLKRKIQELEYNLELQRQFNPSLNPSRFFTVKIKKENSVESINELLTRVCDTLPLSKPLTELDPNLKTELESHPDYKLELHGIVYPSKTCIILPVLIGPDKQIIELGFSRDSCISITNEITKFFKLSTPLKRCNWAKKWDTNYNTQYKIAIPEEALNQLQETWQSLSQIAEM